MDAKNQQRKIQGLEARIKTLEEENKRLVENAEEALLLGLVAEHISAMDQPNDILADTLERIALLKNVPYSAFCEILDQEVLVLNTYASFRKDRFAVDQIHFSRDVLSTLSNGSQFFSGAVLETLGISIQLEGKKFVPSRLLSIPFSTRLIPRGLLLLIADTDQKQFSENAVLLERVLDIVSSRLDNLSLVQELQHLNTTLNLEVDRRVGELRQTNEELRKAMLQRLSIEEALLRQRDLVTSISETSPLGIMIFDRDGKITHANARAEKVLGAARNQLIGRKYDISDWRITDYQGKPLPERALPFEQVMHTKKPLYNIQHAIQLPDSRRILLTINAAPLFDEDYRVDGMVAMIEDVTEQIEADAEFRRLQNFNLSIVQNISEGIVVQDAQGYFTFVNPSAARLLEFFPEELMGKHWKEIIAPEHHTIVEQADARRAQGISDRYQVDFITKSGRRLPVLVSGSPRRDTLGGEFSGTLAVFTDISEQKQAEKNRQAQRDLAVQLSAITGLENVLRVCVEAAIENTEMSAGGIYLVDYHTGNFVLAYSQNLSQEFIECATLFTADSENARLVYQGNPVYLNYSDLDLAEDDFRQRENLQAVAILPIQFEGKVIACLNVTSRTLDIIPETTRNFLEMISTQIGVAIARAQAEDHLKKRADQLSLLNDVGEKIAAVLDLPSVLELTAHLVHASFRYQHVAVFMVDHDKGLVVMRTLAGDFKNLFPFEHTLKLGQGVVGSAAAQNRSIIANNVKSDPHYVNFYPDVIHSQSEMSIPIQIGGRVVGIIDVQSIHLNAFDESDILMMETLADQVAVAIHNANLHESVQKELIERKRIESALRESEEKFRNIVQSSPMGMHLYQIQPDGKLVFIDANPAADLNLGVDNRQFVGKTIEEAFPGLADTILPEKFRRAAITGESWKIEQINYADDQIQGCFEVYAFQTSPGRMVALFLEITERKRAEEALRRSENTLSSIFRVAPTGIGLISEHILLQVNQRVCEMTGFTQAELVGQNIFMLFPTQKHFEYYLRELYRQIKELGSGSIETRWQTKDQAAIDVLMGATPVDPEDLSVGITFTALDITDRKRSEADIQRQLRRLAALSQIDAAITGNLDLNRVIDILLEQTTRQLNVDAAAILRYKPVTQTLEFFAGRGFQTDHIQNVSLRLGQGYAGRAALDRRTIKATDADEHFLTYEIFTVEGCRSYYGVPLIAKGQIKGVLEIFHRQLLNPASGWLSFLETLAGQAAIAVENAEMVENLERSNLELRLAYNTTLEGWAKALELRDFETEGHSRRVTDMTIQLARRVNIPEEELVHVQRGALLHDIGKMGIPDHILLKNGPLDEAEWQIMRMHPIYAYEMLLSIDFLRPAMDIPRYHHEKWDGSGYPYHLKSEQIPLAARVFAVVDVWDALTSDRSYRSAWPEEKVFDLIRSESGKHFDPLVVAAFLSLIQPQR